MGTNRMEISAIHQVLEIIENNFGIEKFHALNTQAKDVMIETLHQALLNPDKEIKRWRRQRVMSQMTSRDCHLD